MYWFKCVNLFYESEIYLHTCVTAASPFPDLKNIFLSDFVFKWYNDPKLFYYVAWNVTEGYDMDLDYKLK